MADAETMARPAGERGKLADAVVLCAMTAFSLALAVGFNHQLGLPLWLSGGVAASIFAGCLAMHLLLARSLKIRQLEAEVARLRLAATVIAPAAVVASASASASAAPQALPKTDAVRAADPGEATSLPPAGPPGGESAAAPAARPAAAPAEPHRAVEQAPVERADMQLDAVEAQVPEAMAVEDHPRPNDFEMIQSLVKKLAAEVEANERRAAEAAAMPAPANAPVQEIAQDAIEQSIDALKIVAEGMHRHDTEPATAPTIESASAAQAARPELVALAVALQAQRVDVMLEPILGLKEQRASHYEVSLRLRDETGEPLPILDRAAELSGSGLLPLIDIARLSRTAEVARRLKDRGADGSVFSDLAGESLVDNDFLVRVAEAYRAERTFADGLVMSFTQGEARTFTPAQWETLLHMRDLGFRFSLKDITDLDMDFEALARAGFRFAKLDAEVFLVGLPLEGDLVPSRDICRHLSDAGLSLIVGRIDEERQLVRVLGFGALFGQGGLFGVPRQMRAELFGRPASAAA